MNLFLPAGYVERLDPAYEHDVQDGGVVWQPDVYADAYRRIASEGRRKVIVDVGCGRAGKLVDLRLSDVELQTLGIDYGPNVDWLQREYPKWDWLDEDLESIAADAVRHDLIAGATIICADVVEHLRDPRMLLLTLRAWLQEGDAAEVVLTTPERVLTWGPDHKGPPPNSAHCREHSSAEFEQLLRYVGLEPKMGLTRSMSTSPYRHTIEAIIRRQDA